jgi:hypothetical protein
MFKYYITKEDFNALKKDIKFMNAIRLLRMENIIITFLSLITKTYSNDTNSDRRDRMEIILYYGAVLYESLNTIYNMKAQLENLNEYKRHIKDINYLFQELNNPDSFVKTILKRIRDKLTFHFDEDVFQEVILKMDLSEDELTILEAESERSIDVNYTTIPTLYYNYLISYINEDWPEEEKIKYIINKMNSIATKLREVIGNIAGELLIGTVHHKEN